MGRFFDRWLVGAGGVIVLLAAAVVLTFQNTRRLNDSAFWLAHTHEVIIVLEELTAHLREAESIQRTYIITGDEARRVEITVAADAAKESLERVKTLTEDNPTQQARIPDVQKRIADLAERWAGTALLRKEQGFEAAKRVVAQGISRTGMNSLEELLRQMADTEKVLLRHRAAKSEQSYHTAITTGLLTGIAALVGVLAFTLLLRRHLAVTTRHEAELEQRVVDRTRELQEALDNVKHLHGLLPICAWCKKVRDNKEYWHEVETYVAGHTDAQFTHAICPDCLEKQLEDLQRRK